MIQFTGVLPIDPSALIVVVRPADPPVRLPDGIPTPPCAWNDDESSGLFAFVFSHGTPGTVDCAVPVSHGLFGGMKTGVLDAGGCVGVSGVIVSACPLDAVTGETVIGFVAGRVETGAGATTGVEVAGGCVVVRPIAFDTADHALPVARG